MKEKANNEQLNALHGLIRREIEGRGPITFARFMELALYHPEHGYYECRLDQIGRQGDYYTSVSLGSLFGKLLALDFSSRLEKLDSAQFDLVECGAHDGTLARDIVTHMKALRPDLYAKLRYKIIEPSRRRRAAQRQNVSRDLDRVSWLDTIDQAPDRSIRGVIFANELLDSFPFHRLRWCQREQQFHEVGVGFEDGQFVWVEMGGLRRGLDTGAASAPAEFGPEWEGISAMAQALADFLPDGFRVDYCPSAARWWRKAAMALAEGALIAIDYGLTREELFSPHRREGTARAYHGHTVSDELLQMPGEQDLTAHVDFSALIEAGEAHGLTTEYLISQTEFVTRTLQNSSEPVDIPFAATQKERMALVALAHPSGLGRAFRVLSQVRN